MTDLRCPTCATPMILHNNETQKIWHCPMCGTLAIAHHTGPEQVSFSPPLLVDRCRKFEETLGPAWKRLFQQLGIREAIHKPEDRP